MCGATAPTGSAPVAPIEAPVLHRLGDVFGLNGFGSGNVRDGATDFENAVVGAGGEAEAADGHFEGALAGIVQRAGLAEEPRGQRRVQIAAGVLHAPGGFDAGPHLGGGGAFGVAS